MRVLRQALFVLTLGGIAVAGTNLAFAEDEGPVVALAPSPEWDVLAVHDVVCVSAECGEKIGAIVATVKLDGNSQAIEIGPDSTKVTTVNGDSVDLSGVMLMKIPESAKASVRGLMTDLTVNLGDTEYVGQLFGFRYSGKFSESLVSGSIVIGANGPAPSAESQAIIELVPRDSDAWLDHGNLPLQRVILPPDIDMDANMALVFIMSPEVGERMLLAGPSGETVTIAMLFGGNHEEFDQLELSGGETLELRPGAFTRFWNSVSDWWAD